MDTLNTLNTDQGSRREPVYTWNGHVLAGAHPVNGRTYRVTFPIKSSANAYDAGTMVAPQAVALPQRETVAAACDMVRRAVDTDDMSASALLPIVRQTCAMLRDPRDATYRAAAMSLGVGSGECDAVMASADPWSAREHETHRPLGLEPLFGTDVTVWASPIAADRSSRCSVAVSRSGLTGAVADATVDDLAQHTDVYTSHTDRQAWPDRVTVKRGPSRASDPTDRSYFVVNSAGECHRVTELVAAGPTVDYRYRGHKLVKRGETVRDQRQKNAGTRRQATDIGTVDQMPTTVAGWRTMLAGLNRGERVKVRGQNGDRVNLTRNAQRYNASGQLGGEPIAWKLRDADALAERLATDYDTDTYGEDAGAWCS